MGTAKVRITPAINATNPSSAPTNFVTGTSIVSMQPAAPAAIGLPLLIRISKGSKITVKIANCLVTAVSDNHLVKNITVFPQPALSYFYVDLPNLGDKGVYTLDVIDLNGRKMMTELLWALSRQEEL